MNSWSGFSDPWEHIRLLSDSTRNTAYLSWLAKHAPGRSVLEVGCGTGILACFAAKQGAKRVIAVEPTEMADVARALVEINQLSSIVEVYNAPIEELEPELVDLAFFELLNADPFVEGILPVAKVTRRWLAADGQMAPRKLNIYAALVSSSAMASEGGDARREVLGIAAQTGLRMDPVLSLFSEAGSYRYFSSDDLPVGPREIVWSLDLLAPRKVSSRTLALHTASSGPVNGVIIWFEAELDTELQLTNAPGQGGHWGQLVCAWPEERVLKAGESLAVRFRIEEGELEAEIA